MSKSRANRRPSSGARDDSSFAVSCTSAEACSAFISAWSCRCLLFANHLTLPQDRTTSVYNKYTTSHSLPLLNSRLLWLLFSQSFSQLCTFPFLRCSMSKCASGCSDRRDQCLQLGKPCHARFNGCNMLQLAAAFVPELFKYHNNRL